MFNTLGTPNNLAIWDFLNQQKVPQLFVATGASDWGKRHQGAPVHDRLAAELRHRGQGLRRLPQEGEAERQGRRALPERRLRQGPAGRLRGGHRGLRHQGRREGDLQRHRPDRLGPGRPARALRCGHVPEHHDAEVLGPGDRDDRQERLEAAAHPQQRRRATRTLVLKPVGLENAKGIVSTGLLQGPAGPRSGRTTPRSRSTTTRSRSTRRSRTPRTRSTCTAGRSRTTMAKALEQMKEPTRDVADGRRAQHGPRAGHDAARQQDPDDAGRRLSRSRRCRSSSSTARTGSSRAT